MATSFFLRTKETQGYTTLFVRLQSRKLGINYKLSTNLEVDIKAWQKAQESAQALQKFQAKEPKLWAKLDKLKQTLDTLLSGDEAPSKEKMRTIIDETVYADILKEQEEALAKAKAAEEAAKRVTLNKYMDQLLRDIASGKRLTEKGTVFTDGSIRTIRTSAKQFRKFQQTKKREYDFDDIDIPFYNDFLAYLKKREYSLNTTGKIINQLKWVMSLAESEGLHHNHAYKNPKFKGNRVQVDTMSFPDLG